MKPRRKRAVLSVPFYPCRSISVVKRVIAVRLCNSTRLTELHNVLFKNQPKTLS